MPIPLSKHNAVVIHDADGNPLGTAAAPLEVSGVIGDVTPGTVITSGANTSVGIGATVALPSAPANTRRATVQITDGDSTTRVRIREASGTAGRGKLLDLLGSTVYGGADGAIADLEAENVVGPASEVSIQFERD